MSKKQPLNMEDYITPLFINGLHGRILSVPPTKKKRREILLVYGHHASLERMFGVAEDLSQYGRVTLPDLPGFGGMESFYKIGEKPTLDNMADYLAAVIKLRFKQRRLTIMGLSFGFIVVTRMLQRYPELATRVDLLVSMVGFVHKDDFKFKRWEYLTLRYTSSIFSRRIPALVMRYVFLQPIVIRSVYKGVADKHSKLKDADTAERDARIAFEVGLWHANDVRTRMDTQITMFTLDLCNKHIKLPIYHIAVDADRYFDNQIVEQHMRVIFSDFEMVKSNLPAHVPTVVADAETAAPFIPRRIRQLLSKASNN